MTNTVDQTKPAEGARWAFDADVTACFDDMLSRSIPGYDTMRELVLKLGGRFVKNDTDIVDLGCSRGASLAPFVEHYGPYIRSVGLDESPPMLQACRERFALPTELGFQIDIRQHDLRDRLPDDLLPSVTLAILTLQFVPIEYRQRLIKDVYQATVPGGVFIVVEKTLGDDAGTQDLFVDEYHAMKREHGYTVEQVAAKRKSLEGVLVPLTADANERMLRAEGFVVSRFWQHLNFVGWLAIRPEDA